MATLYITEYYDGGWPAPFVPPLKEQNLPIGPSSEASQPFSDITTAILLNCDAACSLAFAPSGQVPVAIATAHRMSANETRIYFVDNLSSVAVISNI